MTMSSLLHEAHSGCIPNGNVLSQESSISSILVCYSAKVKCPIFVKYEQAGVSAVKSLMTGKREVLEEIATPRFSSVQRSFRDSPIRAGAFAWHRHPRGPGPLAAAYHLSQFLSSMCLSHGPLRPLMFAPPGRDDGNSRGPCQQAAAR